MHAVKGGGGHKELVTHHTDYLHSPKGRAKVVLKEKKGNGVLTFYTTVSTREIPLNAYLGSGACREAGVATGNP